MIGCDIVEINRFEKLVCDERFLTKLFTNNEIEYIKSKNENSVQTLAGLYSCKEAILKALKLGIGKGIELIDIEIMHDENNAPYVKSEKVMKKLLDLGFNEINVSISHSDKTAIAVCEIL